MACLRHALALLQHRHILFKYRLTSPQQNISTEGKHIPRFYSNLFQNVFYFMVVLDEFE